MLYSNEEFHLEMSDIFFYISYSICSLNSIRDGDYEDREIIMMTEIKMMVRLVIMTMLKFNLMIYDKICLNGDNDINNDSFIVIHNFDTGNENALA